MKKTDLIALIETTLKEFDASPPELMQAIREVIDVPLRELQRTADQGQTALSVLRQIASVPRRTREQLLASSCVHFLDALSNATPADLEALRTATPADPDDAVEEPRSWTLRELQLIRLGLRQHRREMARFIADTPVHQSENAVHQGCLDDLLLAHRLIDELNLLLGWE